MSKTPLRRALAMAGLVVLAAAGVHAATLVQGMGVPELADRADKVFRGTVLGVTQGPSKRVAPSCPPSPIASR